jgi:serine protease Do
MAASLLFLVGLAGVAGAQESLGDLEEQAIQAAVETVLPSVVQIETVGGLERIGRLLVGVGPTTGLVVSEDGYIISSAFNFAQQPTSILVVLPGGQRAAAQVVARDQSRMLVLLKVNTPQKLPVPVAVPRGEMQVGQTAIAVGRVLDKGGTNLSLGIVSATNRIWGKAIQTDAKISPLNYGGPLVDLRGRVLGVLVPLSPQGQESEIAGAEWYDAGIGFAIPLADVVTRLDALKAGKDLRSGILGVSLKRGDIYSLPAEIAAARSDGPAGKAGLKPGDVIVEIDGAPIERQAQLRHALGPKYAGDTVRVVAKRGNDRVETSVTLVEKLEPYEHPFLGLLPMRDGPAVKVRYVFPGSPAAQAGLQAGDVIESVNGAPVAGRLELQDLVSLAEPKKKVSLQVRRGEMQLAVELVPGKLPTEIPPDLPPAVVVPEPPAERPATGLVEIKLPEEASACVALVPENYHPQVPHGVVIWLHGPGGINREALATRWKTLCERHHFILLAPQSADPAKWEPTEAAFVRKTLDHLMGHYHVDRARIAVYGYQASGTMAFLVGLGHTERVRAIVAVDAGPPARTVLPENDPLLRLAFFLGIADKSPATAGMKAASQRLGAGHFPVTTKSLGDQPRDLSDSELAELMCWLDSLDRI